MRRWRDKWASAVIVLAVLLLRRSRKSLAASALASCGSSASKKVPRVITIPPATQARYRRVSRLDLGGVQKRRSKDMVGRGEKRIGRNVLFRLYTRHSFLCFSPQRKLLSLVSR